MTLSDEQLKKMVQMGILGYTAEQCINILDIEPQDEADFIVQFNNPASPAAKNYTKGKDKATYQIDMKLFQMAAEGDLKALAKYEERRAYS
jgi:hypothetical protein